MAYEEKNGSQEEVLLSAEDYASIFEEDPEDAGAAVMGETEAVMEPAAEAVQEIAAEGPVTAAEPAALVQEAEAEQAAETAEALEQAVAEATADPGLEAVQEALEATVEPEPEAVPAPEAAEEAPEAARENAAPPVRLPKAVPQRLPAADGRQLTGALEYTDCEYKQPVRVSIEEDILVPDVKPDLLELLSVAARVAVAEPRVFAGSGGLNSLKVAGDLQLQTLYLYQNDEGAERIATLDSRAAFRDEIPVRAEPGDDLLVSARLESLDYSVVNERKFRIKAVVLIEICEYRHRKWEFFRGIEGEDVQVLEETAELTDLFLRKQEILELEEEWKLKENQPEIGEILSYSINVAENHKQIGPEKAVISGTVYVSALYRPAEGEEGEAGEGQPVFFQEKADFTQFIRLGDAVDELQGPVYGRVRMGLRDVSLKAAENEEGRLRGITLQGDVETTLELFSALHQDVVTDVYHHEQEVQSETGTEALNVLRGTGGAELTARGTIDVPEKYGGVGQVLYVTGWPVTERAWAEQGKVLVEGKVPVTVVCLSAGAETQPISLEQEIPFRSAVEIAAAEPGMEAVAEVSLKELWFDKINSRQVEVNAALAVTALACSRESCTMIKGVSLAPLSEEGEKMPSMVLYVVQPGDTLWKIAKKYRTTVDTLRDVNDLQTPDLLMPGQKLLIVK